MQYIAINCNTQQYIGEAKKKNPCSMFFYYYEIEISFQTRSWNEGIYFIFRSLNILEHCNLLNNILIAYKSLTDGFMVIIDGIAYKRRLS